MWRLVRARGGGEARSPLAPWGAAHAVPSFARQTGFECVACHVSWPELTSVGRQFNLGAYTQI